MKVTDTNIFLCLGVHELCANGELKIDIERRLNVMNNIKEQLIDLYKTLNYLSILSDIENTANEADILLSVKNRSTDQELELQRLKEILKIKKEIIFEKQEKRLKREDALRKDSLQGKPFGHPNMTPEEHAGIIGARYISDVDGRPNYRILHTCLDCSHSNERCDYCIQYHQEIDELHICDSHRLNE